MFNRYKRKWWYKLLLVFLVGLGTLLLAGLLMLTPIGSGVIKKVIESKIDKYIPDAQITYLDYGVNTFSIVVKKGHNVLKIYGEMFPLSAMFEGTVEDLSEFSPNYRGKMNLSGKIYTDRENFVIDGMSFFANGYLNFVAKLDDCVSLHAKGSDFDIQQLLYMLKFNYPYIKGKTDIKIDKNSHEKFITIFKSSGEYSNKVKTDFKAITTVSMFHKDRFDFQSVIESGVGTIDLDGRYDNGSFNYKFHTYDLQLAKMKPVLLYPFNGKISLSGSYDSTNGVMKFKSKSFSGFYDEKIELTFNMDSEHFFNYIGIEKFLSGNISGTVRINDKTGTFDVVSNDSKFLNIPFIRKIRNITGIDLSREKTGKVFFKGYFDSKKTVFDMLSTNNHLSISIKKGAFVYPHTYRYMLYIRKDNRVYKISVNNGRLKVLERRDFRSTDNKVLVF